MKEQFAWINLRLQCSGSLLLLLLAGGCLNPKPSPAPATATTAPLVSSNQLQAGMAEIDITPPAGYRLAGYFNERLATGTHDPLKAKVLALKQGNEEAILVFCDLIGMSLHVSNDARARASQVTGVPVSHIVIAATHSHTGPLFDDVRRDYFHTNVIAKYGKDPQEPIYYPTFLVDKIVKAITQAESKLEPVEIDAGMDTQPGLPFNRRYHMKDGPVQSHPTLKNPSIARPAGPIDSDIGELIVKSLKLKQPIGGLTVFAMHADTADGTEFSADYPYYIEQTLRNYFSQGYVSAFGAGTCGDLNHIDVSKTNAISGFAVTEQLGTTIGETILHHLDNLKPLTKPSLAIRDETLNLPLQTVTAEELVAAHTNIDKLNDPKVDLMTKVAAVKALDLAARGPTAPCEVQVFRLNDGTAIVCLPAEIFVEFGLAIKKESPFKTTYVVTICNDRPSYVPTLKAFKEGSYEVANSRLKAGGGEELVNTALKLLKELKPDSN